MPGINSCETAQALVRGAANQAGFDANALLPAHCADPRGRPPTRMTPEKCRYQSKPDSSTRARTSGNADAKDHGAVRGQPDVDGAKARHLAHRRRTRTGDELHRHRHLVHPESQQREPDIYTPTAVEPRRPALRPGGRRRRQRVRQVLQVQRLHVLYHGDANSRPTPSNPSRPRSRNSCAPSRTRSRPTSGATTPQEIGFVEFGQRAGVSDALHRQRGQGVPGRPRF